MMDYSAASGSEEGPSPLTEGEHYFYSQQPVCHVASQLFSYDPAATLSVFYDAQHGRLLHQVEDLLYILDCTKSHPKLKDSYPIRFTKPKCMLMSFSPCGNFLLYVTAPVGVESDPSLPEEASSKASHEASRQEVGIVDLFGDECLITCVPLRGGTVCDELPSVLQAFWAAVPPSSAPPASVPPASVAEATSLLTVITQKHIELFRFCHSNRTLHALKKVAQVSLLAWVLSSAPTRGPVSTQEQHSSTSAVAAAAAAPAAAAPGPVVFVVAVGQRTLQPFLLDPKTLSLVRLSKIELNLPLWQALQQRDVYLFCLYETAYCVHADSHAGRISLRAITGPLQPDTVLDALAPGELQLLALDNMIVVYHSALDSVLLYDVQRFPVCATDGLYEGSAPGAPGLPGGAPSGGLSLRVKCKPAVASKADISKTVRALSPLVRGTPLSLHPASPYISAGDVDSLSDKKAEMQTAPDGMMDVELQATNLEVACFISPDVIIDGEFGGVYRLALNINAIMHRLLKEKQSLCAAVQVLQNRSGAKAEVLRLSLHALRLETPLSELQPLLFLLNSKYRAAIEHVPLSLVAVSRQSSREAAAAAGGSGEAAAGGPPATSKSLFSGETPESAAAAGISGSRATIPLELLLQSIGSQTVLTERDIVMNVFYPFFRQQFNLPPNALVLDASFPIHNAASRSNSSGASPPLGSSSPCVVLTERSGCQSSRVPYILAVAVEYTRTLLMLQIFPHKVLQAFLFDACAFFKRGDILKQLLQYHLLLDSVDLLQRLFVVWKQLAAAAAGGDRNAAKDERWLRQACLDAALRLKDWDTIASILLARKQHKEIVPLLRSHGATSYPLKALLLSVAADVATQKQQPGLLQHVLNHIRSWAAVSASQRRLGDSAKFVSAPNLRDCGAWLPGEEESTQQDSRQQDCGAAPPKGLSLISHQGSLSNDRLGATETGESSGMERQAATTAAPPTRLPDLIEAIGEVSREVSENPLGEGEEDATKGWASLSNGVACNETISSRP